MFWAWLAGLTAIVLFMPYLAWKDGFLFTAQRRDETYHGRKIAVLSKHGGILSDLVFLNPLVAFVLSAYAGRWSVDKFTALFLIAVVLSVPLTRQWANDSKKMPEALAREGYLTLPGAVHDLYLVLVLTCVGMYYFFTPEASGTSIVLITGALMGHVLLGTLQPSWVTLGHVPQSAKNIAMIGCAALVVLGAVKYFV